MKDPRPEAPSGMSLCQPSVCPPAPRFIRVSRGPDPHRDAQNKPWEAATTLAQARARSQRESLEEAAQMALDDFPPATEAMTPAFGQSGWSVGTHSRCGWPMTALRAFLSEGIEEYLDAGGPQSCLDGHIFVTV